MNGAVSGRSIYDGPGDEGEEDAPWFLRGDDDDDGEAGEDDAAESGASAAGSGVGRGGAAGEGAETDPLAAAITALEGEEAPLLHILARRLGRLDALVEAGAPVARLRAREIADLMWRRGRAVRAERLALYELDGGAPRGDAPEDYALAFWALRRLRDPLDLTAPDTLRAWLGWGRGAPPDALAPVMEARDEAETDAALAAWLAMRAALADRSPPARAAALAGLWAGEPAFGRDRDIVASLLAARLAVGEGESGAPFLPVAIGARRGGGPGGGPRGDWRSGWRGDPAEDARGWLAAMGAAADRALLDLGALAAWRGRATAAASAMQGRTSKALVGALHDHLALSASMAATEMGCSFSAAEATLKKFEAAGLAREITGGAKWRFWTASV